MQSLQGQLLIASPQLLDPNFDHTVTLMVRHGEDGALGVILNRPLQITVNSACQQTLDIPCLIEGFIHQGGPCEGPLMVVHTHEPCGEMEILPGLYFTTAREKIEELLKRTDIPMKFFVGYSGWTSGQLEGELETGSWLTGTISGEYIFDDIDDLWDKLSAIATLGRWIDPSLIPDDPNLN